MGLIKELFYQVLWFSEIFYKFFIPKNFLPFSLDEASSSEEENFNETPMYKRCHDNVENKMA